MARHSLARLAVTALTMSLMMTMRAFCGSCALYTRYRWYGTAAVPLPLPPPKRLLIPLLPPLLPPPLLLPMLPLLPRLCPVAKSHSHNDISNTFLSGKRDVLT
jgi:hypothetical protein